MTSSTTMRTGEVFHSHFSIEQARVQQVVQAILASILFYRSLGNAEPAENDCMGVTMPNLEDPEGTQLLIERSEAVAQRLMAAARDGQPTARVVIALYPTPLPISAAAGTASKLPLPSPRPPPPTSATQRTLQANVHSNPASASPARPSSRTRLPGAAAGAAGAATGAVTSALGWFSASAKAFTAAGGGGAEERRAATSAGARSESMSGDDNCAVQVEDVWGLDKVWEMWVIDVRLAEGERDSSRKRSASSGGGGGIVQNHAEELRQQLHDFSLRSIDFVMRKTAHVPPITSAELRPFGIRILIDPPVLPINLNRLDEPSDDEPNVLEAFPRLHSTLAGAAASPALPRSTGSPKMGLREVYTQYGYRPGARV